MNTMNTSETHIRQKNKNCDYYASVCVSSLQSVRATAVQPLNRVATPWTGAHQAPLSMEFSRQEYWSGVPFPFPGDLSDAGIEPRSPVLQADSLQSNQEGKPMSCNTFPNETCVGRTQVTSILDSSTFSAIVHASSTFIYVCMYIITRAAVFSYIF